MPRCWRLCSACKGTSRRGVNLRFPQPAAVLSGLSPCLLSLPASPALVRRGVKFTPLVSWSQNTLNPWCTQRVEHVGAVKLVAAKRCRRSWRAVPEARLPWGSSKTERDLFNCWALDHSKVVIGYFNSASTKDSCVGELNFCAVFCWFLFSRGVKSRPCSTPKDSKAFLQ